MGVSGIEALVSNVLLSQKHVTLRYYYSSTVLVALCYYVLLFQKNVTRLFLFHQQVLQEQAETEI